MSPSHIAGVVMLIVSTAVVVAFAIAAALRVRRVVLRVKALRAHPALDPEWRARKIAVVNRISAAAAMFQSDLPRLSAALQTIAEGIDGLVSAVSLISASVEAIFGVAVPWLRGLLA